jgi:anhydro-N-acetylmuramic acid kinase
MGSTVGNLVAIGLMSGTSLDGVDVALIETDGERVGRFGPRSYHAYADAERALLRRALADAVPLTDRASRPGVLAQAEQFVTRVHAEAVERFIAANGIARKTIDVVGFHGQTILHRPDAALTVQIGDGAWLAQRLGVPVVFDFRAADVAAGGQGAPLVPVFHRALVHDLDRSGPVAVLNVGGVANVTYLDGSRDPVACDTGPGNALIDDFMRVRTGEALDRDGAGAATGRIDQDFIARVLDDPFFASPCPKSLDRNAFANLQLPALSIADGAATLTALTAAAVARIVPHLPQPPRGWIVAGGGSRNRTLMRMLAERLAPASIETADDVGWSADALEAQAFAYLAVRRLRGLPITFPTTTGAPRPMTGGVLAPQEEMTSSQITARPRG